MTSLGKVCPKYYVEHSNEWDKFKADVYNKINGNANVPENPVGSEEKPMKHYHNGSTKEKIFADTLCTKQIGYLSPYEQCDCFGIFENRALVRYKVDGKNNYKIGFAKWLGGVK